MWMVLDFKEWEQGAGPSLPAGHRRRVFRSPRRIIRANMPGELPGALAALEEARVEGRWLAGRFSYELGYALEPRLGPQRPTNGPLLLFGVFDAPSDEAPISPPGRAYAAGPLRPEWDAASYGKAFARVKDYIAAGDIYQANLSFRARFVFAGDPFALYSRLLESSAAPCAAYIADETGHILSLSPELFFDLTADGLLTARPMKGTIARQEGDREKGAAALAASVKDRAENLMIVDLIRNDLGRIATLGSVTARDLFRIETYPTLHTMVSTVTAQLKPRTSIAEIARALFPCGSVTGAPKIRAMEILRELETSPRGAYCGAIGFFAPDGSARFNVSIRTLTISGNAGELGVGGGVVQDSTAGGEYAECLLKARFFEARRPLALIETLRFEGDFVRLERHLARMAHSAEVLGLAFNRKAALTALRAAVDNATGVQRLRLVLDEAGLHQATAAPLPPNPAHWRYAVSSEQVDSTDLLLRHKTDWRDLYEREAARYSTDEVIFLNERGELTEGSRSNIFVRRDGELLTPSLSSGLLGGCLRAELIERGKCREAVLRPADLKAGEVYFGNSLRGLIPAVAT